MCIYIVRANWKLTNAYLFSHTLLSSANSTTAHVYMSSYSVHHKQVWMQHIYTETSTVQIYCVYSMLLFKVVMLLFVQ